MEGDEAIIRIENTEVYVDQGPTVMKSKQTVKLLWELRRNVALDKISILKWEANEKFMKATMPSGLGLPGNIAGDCIKFQIILTVPLTRNTCIKKLMLILGKSQWRYPKLYTSCLYQAPVPAMWPMELVLTPTTLPCPARHSSEIFGRSVASSDSNLI